MEDAGLPEGLRFLRGLWALDHALQVASKRMRGALGITAPQRLTLRILGVRGEMGAGEIAEVLHLHPATLTGILDRLVRRGFVERRSDPADARRARLRLTERGRRLARPTEATVEAAVLAVLRRFPAAAVRSTRDLLAALTEEVTRPEGDPARPARTWRIPRKPPRR